MSRIAVASLVAPQEVLCVLIPTPLLVPTRFPPAYPLCLRAPMQQEWYEENGRWYHAWQKGLYMYPHDEEERHRMDVYHNLFYDKAGLSLHSARLIPEVTRRPRIMDLGCGTGFWAIDMGEQYPEGEVLGLDLANLQPAQIPPNVRFQIPFNFETPYWSLGQDSWDLIHMQMLCGSVSSWPNLYAKVISQWYDYLVRATDQTPKTIRYSHNTRQALSQAGFTDISERVIKAPYRAWSTDPTAFNIGNFHQTALDLCAGLEALSLGPFSRVFGWSKQEIEGFLTGVRAEIRNRSIHAYTNIHVWTARRPLAR
ncbi:methyltransferase LaeA [Aureobasidium pullulans]|nr:methyltransferase LaeA [Aureobasidium pullulans]